MSRSNSKPKRDFAKKRGDALTAAMHAADPYAREAAALSSQRLPCLLPQTEAIRIPWQLTSRVTAQSTPNLQARL